MFLPITQQILQHWHFPRTGKYIYIYIYICLQDFEINARKFPRQVWKIYCPGFAGTRQLGLQNRLQTTKQHSHRNGLQLFLCHKESNSHLQQSNQMQGLLILTAKSRIHFSNINGDGYSLYAVLIWPHLCLGVYKYNYIYFLMDTSVSVCSQSWKWEWDRVSWEWESILRVRQSITVSVYYLSHYISKAMVNQQTEEK